MKTIRKCLTILLSAMLLCAGAITLTASAASLQDLGALLVAQDSAGGMTAASTTLFSMGGKTLLVSPAIEGESFFYQSASSMFNTKANVQYVGSDKNGYISVYEMTSTISNIPVLESGSIGNSSELVLLYLDSSSKSFQVCEVSIAAAQEGLMVLNGAPSTAVNGVLLDSNASFVGYMFAQNSKGCYAVSTDYIQVKVLGGNSTNNPTQEQPTQEQPTQEQPTQEQPTQEQPTQGQPTQAAPTDGSGEQGGGSGEQGGGSGEQGGTEQSNGTPTFLTILFIAVVGGLIVLVVRSKSKGGADAPVLNGAEQQVLPAGDGVGRMCIRGEGGLFDGRKFEIEGSVTIGRQAGRCNICYPEDTKGVSGMHCQLRSTGSQIELIDLGSSYGTYVNGTQINPNVPVMLNAGDRFWLASPTNTFVVYR